jgi:hypothetical protein
MSQRAHLKLIVSDSPPGASDEAGRDRTSMVLPVSSWRLRLRWLRAHGSVIALWSASVVLLSLAGLVALGWL